MICKDPRNTETPQGDASSLHGRRINLGIRVVLVSILCRFCPRCLGCIRFLKENAKGFFELKVREFKV